MKTLRSVCFCIIAFSQCVTACEVLEMWAPETPLPRSLESALNEALSKRDASSRNISETRKRRGEEDGWMVLADVDEGLKPDGTYRIRHIKCDYKSESGWLCDERSGRYIRYQYKLVEIDESLEAYDAALLMQKINALVGVKGAEDDRPLKLGVVLEISLLKMRGNEVLAGVRAGCGIDIAFRRDCSNTKTCKLVYEYTELRM